MLCRFDTACSNIQKANVGSALQFVIGNMGHTAEWLALLCSADASLANSPDLSVDPLA